jgi:hypothetical protein
MHGRRQYLQGRRLGVLTFHRCINYGSYWQARCLVEGLAGMGAEAVLLDHRSAVVTSAELRCAFRPILPAVTPRSDFPAYAQKVRKFLEAFDRLPLSRAFALERPEEVEEFDAIVIGSDEVWNLCHPWYGGCSTFYGEGLRAPLVAYAASFGNQDAACGLSSYWAERLRNFSSLSVRDENSRSILRAALDIDPEMVLDPCLQFPPLCAWQDLEVKRGYIALYGHNFPAWLSDSIRAYARRNGKRVLSIGYRNDWADEQYLAAGPEEFAALIARADGVVTSFFHGCVFAILNQRPFVTVPSAYRVNKVHDLMLRLGTQRHIAKPETDAGGYASLLSEPLDPAVGERVAQLRRLSTDFLHNALAVCHA